MILMVRLLMMRVDGVRRFPLTAAAWPSGRSGMMVLQAMLVTPGSTNTAMESGRKSVLILMVRLLMIDDESGISVSLSSGGSVSLSGDGSRLAISALRNDGAGTDAGHTRVYQIGPRPSPSGSPSPSPIPSASPTPSASPRPMPSASPSPSPVDCFEEDTDFQGNDRLLEPLQAASTFGCQGLCQQAVLCTHWTYDTEQGRCWLKTSDSGRESQSDRISGPRTCPSGVLAKVVEKKKCSSGFWLDRYPSTAQGCLHLVMADSRCDSQYFTWAEYSDKNCQCATPAADCPAGASTAAGSSIWRFVDVEECSTGAHNCHAQAQCSNTAGAFACTCSTGYFGDGVTCTAVSDTLGRLGLEKTSFGYAETIAVTFGRVAGASTTDWIGVYPRSVTAPSGDPAATLWAYVCGSKTDCGSPVPGGVLNLGPGLGDDAWPLAPGEYNLWYFGADGYAPVATTPASPVAFTVSSGCVWTSSTTAAAQQQQAGQPLQASLFAAKADCVQAGLSACDAVTCLGAQCAAATAASLRTAERVFAPTSECYGPTFSMPKTTFEANEEIRFAFHRPSGATTTDWVGLYRTDSFGSGTPDRTFNPTGAQWLYVCGTQTECPAPVSSGLVTFGPSTPLPAGDYKAWYLSANGHDSVATTPPSPLRFTVKPSVKLFGAVGDSGAAKGGPRVFVLVAALLSLALALRAQG
uniref:EGF-like domain-containing protein n=1 Tax=Eutreptiella gymnastica TaxID=73025 RepID=A0A7S4GCD4_9EUGL